MLVLLHIDGNYTKVSCAVWVIAISVSYGVGDSQSAV